MRNEAEVEVLVVTRSRTPTSSELDSFMDALQYTVHLHVDYNLHLRMYEHVRMSRNSNDDQESETATHFSPTP